MGIKTVAIFATCAMLYADSTALGYPESGKAFTPSIGDQITVGGKPFKIAPALATDHHGITAGGVKVYALPLDGWLSTDQFDGAGIGEKFNKAASAANGYRQYAIGASLFGDVPSIRVPAGTYELDETFVVYNSPNLTVDGTGVQLNNFSGNFEAIKILTSAKANVKGFHLNYRNNNVADEAFLIAGQSGWVTLTDIKVTANSSNANFATFRAKQGSILGDDDDNRNWGNFWLTMDRCFARKYSGTDANFIPMCVDLQGCQNAFKAINCSFNNFQYGIVIRNQNGSLLSGISNSVQYTLCDFEGFVGGIACYWTSTGAAKPLMAGGGAFQCRFENGATAFQCDYSEANGTTSAPFQLQGNCSISSLTNYIVDARADRMNFSSLDSGIFSNFVPTHWGTVNVLFGTWSGSGKPSLGAISKPASDGGSFVLSRSNRTTIDGRLSQLAGGGMQIDGGNTYRLKMKHILGLSSNDTLANNYIGSVTLLSGATSVAVVFGTAELNAAYRLMCELPYNSTWWITAKTTAGCTINFGTAPIADQTINWMLVR